jgi:hypothetical protein
MTYLARNTVKGRGASWAKTALLISYVFTATYLSHLEHIKLSIVAINVRNLFVLQFCLTLHILNEKIRYEEA